MPGTRDAGFQVDWFEDEFGFKELAYNETRSNFEYSNGLLHCKPTRKTYTVGDFEIRSLEELQFHLQDGLLNAKDSYFSAGSLTFRNIIGETPELYREKANAGAVFQVSSLFNCLESVPVGYRPDQGVTNYFNSSTQGPASALSCPAALVYRNFFWEKNGQAGKKQIDTLAKLADCVKNDAEGYWTMRNGFCMPRTHQSIGRLSAQIAKDPDMAREVTGKVQVGVHWNTEVSGPGLRNHCVCQVFCSSMPVGMVKKTLVSDWTALACSVLESIYESTLTAAALLATERGKRVKVYLTLVGGGELGARREWIADAIDKALHTHRKSPLDVMLVHYAVTPSKLFEELERGRLPDGDNDGGDSVAPTKSHFMRGNDELCREYTNVKGDDIAILHEAFRRADVNGDGIIDRSEFIGLLQGIDDDVFNTENIDKLLAEADANGDGVIHYVEFIKWIFGEDEDIRNAIMGPASP